MSSINSTGLSDLTQYLASAGSPLASTGLSSAQIQKALSTASPADVVALSSQAVQIQELGAIFGDSSQPPSDSLFGTGTSGGDLMSILAQASASQASQAQASLDPTAQATPDISTLF